jgi:hypothetical protein
VTVEDGYLLVSMDTGRIDQAWLVFLIEFKVKVAAFDLCLTVAPYVVVDLPHGFAQ